MTKFNERTNTLLYKNIPHSLFGRVDVGYVWEVSWRRGQSAMYWPKVLLAIEAVLSHSGWAAQPWVTEGPSPLSGAGSHSASILSPTATATRTPSNWLKLTEVISGTWLYNCLTSTCFLWAYASTPNSTTFTGQDDIPISSTGCTFFAARPLIYTDASLDWRLGRGLICYSSCCSVNAITSMYKGQLKKITYELDLSFPVVFCMYCSSYLNGFRDGK